MPFLCAYWPFPHSGLPGVCGRASGPIVMQIYKKGGDRHRTGMGRGDPVLSLREDEYREKKGSEQLWAVREVYRKGKGIVKGLLCTVHTYSFQI